MPLPNWLRDRVTPNEAVLLEHTHASYWYVITPYTLYPFGMDAAGRMAARITVLLSKAGVPVLSPIAHGDSLAIGGNAPRVDHDFWMGLNGPLMRGAHGGLVYQAKGWQESRGVVAEIAEFERAQKPLVYLSPWGEE